MTDTMWIVGAVVLISVVLMIVLGRQLGWISLNFFGAGITGGQNKGRASAEGANAGRNIDVSTGAGGDASADRSSAGNDINVSSGTKR